MSDYLKPEEIDALRRWPTCAISNAIELFEVRPRNEGFMTSETAASAVGQSEIAIYWDSTTTDPSSGVSYNHIPGGGNVLYMDGHVEFMRYEENGDFPMNAGWAVTVGVASGL